DLARRDDRQLSARVQHAAQLRQPRRGPEAGRSLTAPDRDPGTSRAPGQTGERDVVPIRYRAPLFRAPPRLPRLLTRHLGAISHHQWTAVRIAQLGPELDRSAVAEREPKSFLPEVGRERS